MLAVHAGLTRIGVLEPKFEPYPDAREPNIPGYDVAIAPTRIRRYMTDSAIANGEFPDHDSSVFCETLEDLSEHLKRAEDLRDVFTSIQRETLRDTEVAGVDYLCEQRGYCPGWHVTPGGRVRPGDTANEIESMPIIGRWLHSAGPAPQVPPSRIRRRTNHGDPLYLPGAHVDSDKSLMMHFASAADLLAAGGLSVKWDDVERRFSEYGEFSDRGDVAVPHAVMFSRTGFIRKPQDWYDFRNERLMAIGSCASFFPRRRQVNGVPLTINLMLVPAADEIMYTRKYVAPSGQRIFVHGEATAMRRKYYDTIARIENLTGKRVYVYSDDISAFDDSVLHCHQRQLLDHVYAPIMEKHGVSEVYMGLQRLSVLSPRMRLGQQAFLYDRLGTTISGSRLTAEDGSFINAGRLNDCVAAGLRMSPLQTWQLWLQGVLEYWVQGDDSVVFTPFELDEEAYESRSLAIGYKCKLSRLPVFLQTFLPGGHGLGYRAYGMSIWPEHGKFGPVALIALFARSMRLYGHPKFGEVLEAILHGSRFSAEWGVRNFEDLRGRAGDPAFKELLAMGDRQVEMQVLRILTSLARGADDWRANPLAAFVARYMGLEEIAGISAGSITTAELRQRTMNSSWRQLLEELCATNETGEEDRAWTAR